MVDALVSFVLDRLASIVEEEIKQQLNLVRGVDKEIRSLASTLQSINSVLVDAERKQITNESVRLWVGRLKDVSYDIDDALDEWSTAILQSQIQEQYASVPIQKVCSLDLLLPCLRFKELGVRRRDIARQIQQVNEKLDEIGKEKERYDLVTIASANQDYERPRTTSSIDVSMVYGRNDSQNTLVRMLCGSSCPEESNLLVLAIVGMGGLGKTTLAQLAYDNNEVRHHFENRVWVCVSEPFDEIRVAKAIVEALEGRAPDLVEFETILHRTRESISGKRFLLVLDDVWTEDYNKWEPLRNSLNRGARGSRVLVTTRSERVAMMMQTSHMMPLGAVSDDDCWLIFSQMAFNGRDREEHETLGEIGRRLVERCKGLPLAAKVLGGLMRFKRSKEDWQSVLDSTLWELEEGKKDIISPLWLSYYDLPPPLKRCFSFCAVFPKDSEIRVDDLVKLWMANGYLYSKSGKEMEALGLEYFEILAMRSLFQDFVKDGNGSISRCKMHDIVHDCAQFLTTNECQAAGVSQNRSGRDNSTFEKLRHLTTSDSMGIEKVNTKGLRTFLREHGGSLDFFDHCTRLRVLKLTDFVRTKNEAILGYLDKLVHLRYLELVSFHYIIELPETVCNLCNLQTLKLIHCTSLQKLPKDIRKLVNLRHLCIIGIHSQRGMPKELLELQSLRTLSGLTVSIKDGNGDGCTICDFEKLKHLGGGDLKVTELGKVSDTTGEAKRAGLKNLTDLQKLELSFDGSEEEEEPREAEAARHFLVLEALEPPPHLETLEIRDYRGTALPAWISSLSNLSGLYLNSCPNFESGDARPLVSHIRIIYVNGISFEKE